MTKRKRDENELEQENTALRAYCQKLQLERDNINQYAAKTHQDLQCIFQDLLSARHTIVNLSGDKLALKAELQKINAFLKQQNIAVPSDIAPTQQLPYPIHPNKELEAIKKLLSQKEAAEKLALIETEKLKGKYFKQGEHIHALQRELDSLKKTSAEATSNSVQSRSELDILKNKYVEQKEQLDTCILYLRYGLDYQNEEHIKKVELVLEKKLPESSLKTLSPSPKPSSGCDADNPVIIDDPMPARMFNPTLLCNTQPTLPLLQGDNSTHATAELGKICPNLFDEFDSYNLG